MPTGACQCADIIRVQIHEVGGNLKRLCRIPFKVQSNPYFCQYRFDMVRVNF